MDMSIADGTASPAVPEWRDAERRRLRALRKAIDPERRRLLDTGIAGGLERLPEVREAYCIAVFWPLIGEPDLRPWYEALAGRGVGLALPVVVTRASPLEFRRWRPGDTLEPDAARVPAPLHAEPARPDVIITPCVGFDEERYRLGNGGGYYDRTLVRGQRRPRLIGVGYNLAALPSIHPQSHDVPMHYVVTEDRIMSEPT